MFDKRNIVLINLMFCFLLLLFIENSVLGFFDVNINHNNYDAITYVKESGIVNGYEDGSFMPDKKISRAEFLKIIVASNFSKYVIDNCNIDKYSFDDVKKEDWYTKYVCIGKSRNIISGYNGSIFLADKNISFVEASKIIIKSINKDIEEDKNIWYKNYVIEMEKKGAIPLTIGYFDKIITRGEMAEMMYRIKEGLRNLPSLNYEILDDDQNIYKYQFESDDVFVDTKKIREIWLDWYNAERSKYGLKKLSYDYRLNESAMKWTREMADKKNMTHKRNQDDEYYDYDSITNWFAENSLEFVNTNRSTYSENIASGIYKCKDKKDCTDDLISSMRLSFDFFMKEKGEEYSPHYDSIVNKNFNIIGLGVVMKSNRFYLTVHYATDIK